MEQASTLLDAFLAIGGNVIDTAHTCGGEWVGLSERAVRRWLHETGSRVILVDKGAHHDEHGPRLNPAAIASDLRDSLERLQVDAIDLYLLHHTNRRRSHPTGRQDRASAIITRNKKKKRTG